MKNFFRKLGFRKMDEMEVLISFKAQRIALIYITLAVFLWTLYESYKVYTYHTDLNPFPCFLLVTTILVQNISRFVITRKATNGDEEAGKPNKSDIIVLIISFALVLIGGIITLGVIG